tara:strand:- start:3916 stop:5886 length:1971 start_codon:yes stop_codon:yes gene_type:complete
MKQIGLIRFIGVMTATAIGFYTSLPLANAADEGPESLISTPIKALGENNPKLIWDMLPKSYQKDLNGLVQAFAKEMDAELWDAGFDLAGSLGEVLRTKNDIISESLTGMAEQFGLPLPELDLSEMSAGMEMFGAFFEKISTSDIGTIAKLKTIDLGNVANTLGKEIMTMMEEAGQASGETDLFNQMLENIQVEVVSEDGDNATIKVSGLPNETDLGVFSELSSGLPADLTELGIDFENPIESLTEVENSELEVMKVEGKWIPKEMAEAWKEGMNAAKQELQEGIDIPIEDKRQALATVNALRKSLNSVKKAKTPQQFQLAMMGAFMSVGAAIEGGSGNEVSSAQKAEARKLADGEISLTNGDIIEGTVADVDQNGIVVRRDIGGFARRANWMELTQESLKKIRRLGQTDPERYKGASVFAEPFIEPDESKMEQNLPPGPVRGLIPPDVPEEVQVTSKLAAYGTGGGIGLIVAIAIGSMVAGLGVAAFRETNALLAASISLILPVIGPILILVKPEVEYEDDYEDNEEYEFEEADAPEGVTMSDTGGSAVAGMLPEAKKMSFAQSGPKNSSLKPQTWTSGDTRFDRSFFQNNFPNYFKVVLGNAERGMVLALKTGKREYVGQRIKRISGTDLHMELLNGKEQKISFSEIGSVDLRQK